MPIILPKCKKDYELDRNSCSCKKRNLKHKKRKRLLKQKKL